MTREERARELNAIRQTRPERLIATYRAATNTPQFDQLPRGLGFTGMIEAILDHEFQVEAPGTLEEPAPCLLEEPGPCMLEEPGPCSLREVADASDCVLREIATACVEPATQRSPCASILELRAFCSGAAMVFTGLFMAALYLLMTNRLSV
jgi:hypothetical protein